MVIKLALSSSAKLKIALLIALKHLAQQLQQLAQRRRHLLLQLPLPLLQQQSNNALVS
jgi:hypothetical protein